MKSKKKDLFKNKEFIDFLFTKLSITNPIPAKKIIALYQIRKDHMKNKGNALRVRQFSDLIETTKSSLDVEKDFVVGVSVKSGDPYIFYFNEDFSKILGRINDDEKLLPKK